MAIDLNGIVTWLKGWFYDKTEITGFLNNKANQSDLQTLQGTVTSLGETVNGKIDTAGTGLSKSGTTLNHSNNVTAQSSAVFKKIKYDGQGHITGTANVSGDDLPQHGHSTDLILDTLGSYSNIDVTTPATQLAINTAIDTAIGTLSSIRAIEVVSTLPTASSSTMGKLYIISENSKINVYYTEQDGSSYDWHKMDTDILDELSISWNDITNKPSTFSPSSHSHSISNINNLQTTLNGKAPTSHASSETTYGVGTTSNYGHNKIRDNLTASTLTNGESLSAHQGYVLKGLIDDLEDTIVSFDASNIDFDPSSSIWGEYVQVVSTVANGLDWLKTITNNLNTSVIGKQDEITSIVLVPKNTDANGKIIFYTGDEPT